MDLDKHIHRTKVLSAILAYWAENEELSFADVLWSVGIIDVDDPYSGVDISDDEKVVELCRAQLKPKSQYYMIQVGQEDKHILNGYDRRLVTPEELGLFMANLRELANNTQLFVTAQMLSEPEYHGALAAIEEIYQQQKGAA